MEALYHRASAYDENGDYQLAISDYDRVLSLDPGNYGALVDRCWSRAVLERDLELAIKDCDQALALTPSGVEALDARGFLDLKLRKFNDALTHYGAALGENPNRASARFGRGIARLASGSGEGGADIAAAEAAQPGITKRFAR